MATAAVVSVGRVCKKCGEWKPREEMSVNAKYKDGMDARCRICKNRDTLARYYENHEQRKADSRRRSREMYRRDPDRVYARSLRHLYGIDKADYDALMEKQGGACAICRQKCATGARLSVDHNHDTGAVRGLLCKPCNMALGMFKDSPERLATAIAYLSNEGAA